MNINTSLKISENTNYEKKIGRMEAILKVLIFVCLSFLFFGCTPKEKQWKSLDIHSKVNVEFVDSINAISIQNTKDHAVKFTLNINNLFPLDYKIMAREINNLSVQNNIPSEMAAWMFVSNNTFHSKPLTGESWQHNPQLFLNSIGGGFCDDRASVLAKLWRKNGDSSRVIGLEGHIVPEILVDGKWQMYDPDYNVYYCNENGVPKSVAELEVSKDSILTSNCTGSFINPVFTFKNQITEKLTKLYKSADNNYDATHGHLNYSETNNEFILPAHSRVEIIHNKKLKITNVVLKLTPKSKGKLKIPLIPYQGRGEMKFSAGDQVIDISKSNADFPTGNFYSEMEIISVGQKSEIDYLFNPKLSIFKAQNQIEINSSDSLNLESFTNKSNNPKILFAEERLFYNQKTIIHKEFLYKMQEFEAKNIDTSFVKDKFVLFLNDDKSLTEQQKSIFIDKFDTDLKKILSAVNYKEGREQVLNYPASIFYLFLAARYQKMDYIFKILNQQK